LTAPPRRRDKHGDDPRLFRPPCFSADRRTSARGFAVGLASHGIGTARAFAVDPVAGAFAMGLIVIVTPAVTPALLPSLIE
jgi:putative effector of murein hydrolase